MALHVYEYCLFYVLLSLVYYIYYVCINILHMCISVLLCLYTP